MPRQRRLRSRSARSLVSSTATSPARRPSRARAAPIRVRSGAAIPARRALGGLATEIDIGLPPPWLAGLARFAMLPRRLGVGHADVEDRGQHRDEGLADARQLLERQPALVELPLLDALLDDARHQPADPARGGLG